GERQRRRAAPSEKLVDVITECAGQERECADVRNDLQPCADKCDAVSAEGAGEMRVLAARQAAERSGEKDRIGDGGGQNRRREDHVSEDHARAGEGPGLTGDFEDAGTDQDADQRGVRLESAEIAAQADRHRDSLIWSAAAMPPLYFSA